MQARGQRIAGRGVFPCVAIESTSLLEITVNKTPSLVAAMLLALTAGAALAQAPAATPAQKPERRSLDTNNDGVIDRAEAAAHPRLAAQFDTLDANKDGKLDRSERPRAHHRHGRGGERGHPFAALDADKDGRISQAEAAKDPKFAERFARMDSNKDGFIDTADRELAGKQRRDAWFASADTNGDGSLSRAEFDAAHAKAREHRSHGWGRHPAGKDAAAK